nr:unnamed protein product [Callosobruchus chinensis]
MMLLSHFHIQHLRFLRPMQKKRNLLRSAKRQLKKAENGCDQVKDENAMLKRIVTHLQDENASENKTCDIAEAEQARIKENKSKLRGRMAQLDVENKRLKLDLSNALDDAKRSMESLSIAKDVYNTLEQWLMNLKNKNGRLKKKLEKALAEAQADSTRT